MVFLLKYLFKAICTTFPHALIDLGRAVVNFVQWSMIVYPVFHPQSMLSSTVVMLLGCIILVFGLVEIVMDMSFSLAGDRPTAMIHNFTAPEDRVVSPHFLFRV